jgi:Uma2 family endonuclease
MKLTVRNAPNHYFTLEEYYALERASERRFEYWDGDIVCVNGIRMDHAIISSDVMGTLSSQLARPTYRVFSGSMPIKTPSLPPYRYPDVSVAGTDMQFEGSNDRAILLNPLLVIEVLEQNTEAADRQEKRLAYQSLPTVRELLLIADVVPHVTRYSRQEDGWQRTDYRHLKAVIEWPSFDCQLALAEIYQGVIFA